MSSSLGEDHVGALRERVAGLPGLGLLVLYGSRARGGAHERSEWDFGYLAAREFDADGLVARLADPPHRRAD
jgi:predicted nucleotidyltransferase